VLLIGDCVGRSGRVVAIVRKSQNHYIARQEDDRDYLPDLLTDQGGLAHLRIRVVAQPLADKQLTQEGVERLLLTAKLLATAAVLLV